MRAVQEAERNKQIILNLPLLLKALGSELILKSTRTSALINQKMIRYIHLRIKDMLSSKTTQAPKEIIIKVKTKVCTRESIAHSKNMKMMKRKIYARMRQFHKY